MRSSGNIGGANDGADNGDSCCTSLNRLTRVFGSNTSNGDQRKRMPGGKLAQECGSLWLACIGFAGGGIDGTDAQIIGSGNDGLGCFLQIASGNAQDALRSQELA